MTARTSGVGKKTAKAKSAPATPSFWVADPATPPDALGAQTSAAAVQPDSVSAHPASPVPVASPPPKPQAPAKPDAGPVPCPFRIVADTREQQPYTFSAIASNAETGHRPFSVEVLRHGLAIGDYTVEGAPGILIERKSKADLFSSVARRENFEHRLERLDVEAEYAGVVVEAEWSEIMGDPPAHSQLNPTALHRTIQSWSQRYSRVHWWFYPGRQAAEIGCFWLLYRWWSNATHHRAAADRRAANHQAYLGGIGAYRLGIPVTKFPYPEATTGTLGDHWVRGWLDMEQVEKTSRAGGLKAPAAIEPAAPEQATQGEGGAA